MKIRTSILAGMLFIGSFGAVNSAIAEDGVLSKEEFTPSNYCHMKFRAMRESTIAQNHPELNRGVTSSTSLGHATKRQLERIKSSPRESRIFITT